MGQMMGRGGAGPKRELGRAGHWMIFLEAALTRQAPRFGEPPMRKKLLTALFCALCASGPASSLAAPATLTTAALDSPFKGPLAKARDALDRGELDTAREILRGQPESAARRVLDARMLSLAGEDARAARAFVALRQDFPRLADHWSFEAAVRFARVGDWANAKSALDAVPAASRYADRACFERSNILEAEGDLKGARAVLDDLARRREPKSGEDLGATALLRQAALSKRMGDVATRRAALVAVWRDHPRTALDSEALREICADNLVGDKDTARQACPPLGLEEHLRRAERLVELHHNQRAIAALEPIVARLKLPKPAACRAHLAFGEAHRKERLHERAIEIFTPIVERCPAQKEKALYSLASSQSIAHPERGPRFYDRFIADFPRSPNLAQAEWFAAALEIQNEQIDAASRRLESLSKRFPKSRYASEALFKRFWLDWRACKIAESVRWLDTLLARYPGKVEERQRAIYWKARADERLGRVAEATAADESLSREAPVSHYGVMALKQLERSDAKRACAARHDIARAIRGEGDSSKDGATKATASQERSELIALFPLKLEGLRNDIRLDAALDFIRLGMLAEARDLLTALSREKWRKSDKRVLAVLMGIAGDFRGAQWITRVHFASTFDKAPSPETRGLWTLAWPLAHRAMLERHCSAHGVTPDLLQALMREESALDPLARSWAGALGLTQLMPTRAQQVAQIVGRTSFKEEELFDPSTSIEFGCAWLGTLLREFAGEPMHAFAAYNADSDRVRHWLSLPSGRLLDHFVEQIPIAETRGYVKRLVRSEAVYRWLYQPINSLAESCGEQASVTE